ncbi:uncharacterized protein LOC133801452 isoform X1 [Humulus lupulus]|nr:uncharacterized protein LOC133801452 isoform X1 [Humulus lupulus]
MRLKTYPELIMRKFDRIIFNFPHAGFGAREDDNRLIHKHRILVHGFFWSARSMLRPNGEIHVNHKTTPPFSLWNLEQLATWNSLSLIECVEFNIKDYPGYNNKRGDGARCDLPFPLGKCSTFKFRLSTTSNNGLRTTSSSAPMLRRFGQCSTSFDFKISQNSSVAMFNQDFHQPFQRFPYPPSDHIVEKSLNFDYVRSPLEASVRNWEDYREMFSWKLEYTEEIQGLNHLGMVSPVNDLRHKRTADHGTQILVESNKRTCFDMGPSFNEVRHSFNSSKAAMLPGRITNHDIDMHRYPESDQRTCQDVDSPFINELRYSFSRDNTQMLLGRTLNQNMRNLSNFDRRTCDGLSFPVNEPRLGFSRDRTTLLPRRTLNNGNHLLPECEYNPVESRRLVWEFGN